MAADWMPWTLGPLTGAVAGAGLTWVIEQARWKRRQAATATAALTAKVQEHETRIAVLENERQWSEVNTRRRMR